jgi:MOSC domain-containing protein YiiM
MCSVDQVEAVAGRGLKGDRYYVAEGTRSRTPKPGQQVTLIEIEAIEAAAQEAALDFQSEESRRNIVTRGVPLNDLVGREFKVGGVRLRGVELCEPCAHMIRLSGKKVLRSLVHHGGIRADVVGDGVIHIGDAVAAE